MCVCDYLHERTCPGLSFTFTLSFTVEPAAFLSWTFGFDWHVKAAAFGISTRVALGTFCGQLVLHRSVQPIEMLWLL